MRHLCDHIFQRFFLPLDGRAFAILHTCWNGTSWQVDTLVILDHVFRNVDVLVGVICRLILLFKDRLAEVAGHIVVRMMIIVAVSVLDECGGLACVVELGQALGCRS